jgi:hypothetical protein
MNKPRTGDIYRWAWNAAALKEREHKNEAGTMYWCCSRICVFKDDEKFWDTYWGGNDYNHDKRFSIKDANTMLDLQYLGNFSDLEKANKSDRAYYEDKDCVDLSHANSSRGNFYIRKGAKKSLDKMRRVMKRNLAKLQRDADCAQKAADRIRTEIDILSEESYLPTLDGVALTDTSYEDENDT